MARPVTPDALRVTYLGVNGYLLETRGHGLLIDPYFTRVPFSAVALDLPIKSDGAKIDDALRHVHTRIDAVLVTHAHFDHLLDVPTILERTGAELIAGATAVELVRPTGSRAHLRTVKTGEVVELERWKISVLPAKHDRVLGITPFARKLGANRTAPRRASDWLLGEPFAYVIDTAGQRVYVDSGGTPGGARQHAGRVDLAILGVALPDSRRRLPETLRALRPRYVLPSHQDNFFRPFDRGFTFGPLTDFPAVVRTHEREKLPGRIVLLDYFRPWTIR